MDSLLPVILVIHKCLYVKYVINIYIHIFRVLVFQLYNIFELPICMFVILEEHHIRSTL